MVVAVALVYAVAARWGLSFWTVQPNVTLVWPPAGIALAAFLVCGYWVFPGVLAGAFIANVTAGGTIGLSLAAGVGNVAEGLLAAYALQRVMGLNVTLQRVRDVLGLLVLGVGLSPLVVAVIGTSLLCAMGVAGWSSFGRVFGSWWSGDALGVLIVTPVLLTLVAQYRGESRPRRPVEAAAYFVLLAIAGYAVFGALSDPARVHISLAYAAFPFLIWAAFRYGTLGATGASLLISAIAAAGIAQGRGPFGGYPLEEGLPLLLLFIGVFALTALLLSAVLSERACAVAALRGTRDELETRVEDRTTALRRANGELRQEIAGRERVEEALEGAREEKESILDSLMEHVVYHDEGMRVLWANRVACERAGVSREQLTGKHCYVLWGDGSRPCPDCPVRRALRTGEQHSVDRVTLDGRAWHLEAYPVRDAEGHVVGATKIALEITERKRTEEALRRSERRYRELYESSRDGYAMVNREGKIVEFNTPFREMLGYSEEELRELTYQDITPARWHEMEERIVRDQVYGRGYSDVYEKEYRRKDGRTIPIEIRAQLTRDEYERPVGIWAFVREITARKRAQEQLQRTTRTLNSILDSATEYAIVAIDRRFRVVHFSPAAERLFGYSAEAIVGEHVRGMPLWGSISTARIRAALRESLRNGKWEGPLKLRRPDGGPATLHAVAMPMRDEQEQTTGLILFAQDVTAREQADELVEAQRDLGLVLGSTNDLAEALRVCVETALRVADMDSGGLYIADAKTGAFEPMHHTSGPGEAAGGLDRWEPDSPQVRRIIEGRPVFVEDRALLRQIPGCRAYRSVGLVPILHEGKAIGCLCVATRRMATVPSFSRRALESIAAQVVSVIIRLKAEQARVRLATAVEQAGEAVVITDLRGRIEYANPAFERITGYSQNEIVGRRASLVKSGEHDAAFYRELWDTITSGKTWTGRFVNRRKDGRLYQEDALISPVRDGSGKIVNYVAVKRDVTRETILEAQLRQSEKLDAVGQLAGGVAHEFNNLLTAILGQSESIAQHVPAEHPAAACAERIRTSTDRAAELVRQLMAFGRKQIGNTQVLDLSVVAENAAQLLRPLIGEHIRIETEHSSEPAWVRADAGQLQQMITSLSVNARDAMPDGGVLKLQTTVVDLDEEVEGAHEPVAPGHYVTLAVQDTGRGMDGASLRHLFEPFFTTKGLGRGTGLGLAAVHGIVRQHDGRIVVQSAPGEGTTFRVYLPRVAEVTEADEPERVSRSGGQGERPAVATLLLVEDEPEVREVECDILEAQGYTVFSASNGDEALAIYKRYRGQFDLLVTDVVMPGMNGPELAERIAGLGRGTKVLYISGYTDSYLSEHTRLEVGTAFLAKPFTSRTLAEKVRAVLGTGAPRAAGRTSASIGER